MNKNYLIIGGTSGFGLYLCDTLLRNKETLYVTGRELDKLNAIKKHHENCIHDFRVDLYNEKDIDKLFGNIDIQFDGMVYLAGLNSFDTLKGVNIQYAKKTIDINFLSFLSVMKYFTRKNISKDGASIVALSSIASLSNPPGMLIYSASKAALNSSVKTLSQEYIRRHLRINAVLPGYLEFPMCNEPELSEVSKIQPWGRIPYSHVSSAVEFLLSDDAYYITGNLIEISGGQIC